MARNGTTEEQMIASGWQTPHCRTSYLKTKFLNWCGPSLAAFVVILGTLLSYEVHSCTRQRLYWAMINIIEERACLFLACFLDCWNQSRLRNAPAVTSASCMHSNGMGCHSRASK